MSLKTLRFSREPISKFKELDVGDIIKIEHYGICKITDKIQKTRNYIIVDGLAKRSFLKNTHLRVNRDTMRSMYKLLPFSVAAIRQDILKGKYSH